MNSGEKAVGMEGSKARLSALWAFVSVNYIFCDVLSNMESEELKGLLMGSVGAITVTQAFLLGAAIMMEIPFAMIALSRFLEYRANRRANIIAGILMAGIQVSSLFFGTPPTEPTVGG